MSFGKLLLAAMVFVGSARGDIISLTSQFVGSGVTVSGANFSILQPTGYQFNASIEATGNPQYPSCTVVASNCLIYAIPIYPPCTVVVSNCLIYGITAVAQNDGITLGGWSYSYDSQNGAYSTGSPSVIVGPPLFIPAGTYTIFLEVNQNVHLVTSQITGSVSVAINGPIQLISSTGPAQVTVTPEPATPILLATGLGTLALMRKRLTRVRA